MDRSKGKRIVRTVLLLAATLAATVAVAHSRGLDAANPLRLNARYLSDGFFVVGFLMTGLGALVWISTTGFFDMMSYAVRSLMVLFTGLRRPKEYPSFYDYKVERDARRAKPQWMLLIMGVAYLALSGICLAVYYG